MKKFMMSLLLLSVTTVVCADTWLVGKVLYGNICRNGDYYSVYDFDQKQPVGSRCNLYMYNDPDHHKVIGSGVISNE